MKKAIGIIIGCIVATTSIWCTMPQKKAFHAAKEVVLVESTTLDYITEPPPSWHMKGRHVMTISPFPYLDPSKEWVVGDFNLSESVDEEDTRLFYGCVQGPGFSIPYNRVQLVGMAWHEDGVLRAGAWAINCSTFDLNKDKQLDMNDFAILQRNLGCSQ